MGKLLEHVNHKSIEDTRIYSHRINYILITNSIQVPAYVFLRIKYRYH